MLQTVTGSSHGYPASFRDPSAFVFRRDGILYRQINHSYVAQYRMLMDTGLAAALQKRGMLIRHQEAETSLAADPVCVACVIRPDEIPFVSYPWEWSFAQHKAAALLTLDIMEEALRHGMILKDANARNIQFAGSRPVLIDTSSFERYDGGVWVAYRQFCEHFLLPLALRAYGSPVFRELLRGHIDGIPLQDGVKALPFRARFSPGLLLHGYGHAWFASGRSDTSVVKSRRSQVGHLVESLRRTVERLHVTLEHSVWSDYDPSLLYGPDIDRKKDAVLAAVATLHPSLVWDIGANDGFFPLAVASPETAVIAMESDPDALERCFAAASVARANVLPLSFDFNNPTAGGGVLGTEILPIFDRKSPDLILMLGIVHHLCVTQNIPLTLIPAFCGKAGARHLLIEWIAPEDDRAAPLLTRKPVHHPYDRGAFDSAFAHLKLLREDVISPTRTLLLFAL